MSCVKTGGVWLAVGCVSNVAFWHIADVQRLTDLGPLTGALPTFGAECRFIGA